MKKNSLFTTSLLFSLLLNGNAFACSVCFGDPDSNMSKGTAVGVLFLGVVIVGVLTTIAITIRKWAKRGEALKPADFDRYDPASESYQFPKV